MTYKVWSLDVWGHGSDHEAHDCDGSCDGWTVNDRTELNGTIEFNEDATDKAIIKLLVKAGFLKEKCLEPGYIKIDGEDGLLLFVDRASDDFPIFQLEAI